MLAVDFPVRTEQYAVELEITRIAVNVSWDILDKIAVKVRESFFFESCTISLLIDLNN